MCRICNNDYQGRTNLQLKCDKIKEIPNILELRSLYIFNCTYLKKI